jgi:RNA ligase
MGKSEGFVIRFESGFRVKLKFTEYVRLHKILTNFTSRDIWESLREKRKIEEILDNVPDEFYQWVKKLSHS